MNRLWLVILVFCVCLSVPPEISRIGGRIATLLTKSWRASPGELHKQLFKPTWCAVWEKKPLEAFRQLLTEFHACTITLPVTLGRMNLPNDKKAAWTFSKGMHWRTCPAHHGYHCWYCFLREWATDTSQYEKLITRLKTNPFVNGLRLVFLYNNTRILCVCVCRCVSVCVSVQPEISGMGGGIAMPLAPSWRALPGELHKLLFEPIRSVVREKKPLQIFCQLRAESHTCTVTFLVTLGRMNLATTTKRLEHSRRVCVEGHALHITGMVVTPGRMNLACYLNCAGTFLKVTREGHILHIMGTIVAIAFYVHGAIVILPERDTGLLPSMSTSLNSRGSPLNDERPTCSWMG